MPDHSPESTVATLLEAVGRLAEQRSSVGVLEQVVTLAPRVVPAARRASVTVDRGSAPGTPAASDRIAERVDEAQYRTGQGPCLDAARTGQVVLASDLAIEPRWPQVTGELLQRHGVRSMLSLPLPMPMPMPAEPGVAAALNLSAARPQAFPAPARAAGALLAGIAGLALAAVGERERGERAGARAQQVEDFNAALAHDLRARMTTLLGARDVLTRRRDQLDAAGRQALDLLAHELGSQHRLLVDLLDLARDRAAAWPAAPVPLLRAVQQIVYQHPAPVPVRAELGAAHARVSLPPVRLRQILANLLDNAERHAGGASGVAVGTSGQQAWVAVEDAGPGIAHGQREQVFTRFGQHRPDASEDGHHLGLALSRLTARHAGGDLTVANRPGGGARFLLVLPAVTSTAPDQGDAGSALE